MTAGAAFFVAACGDGATGDAARDSAGAPSTGAAATLSAATLPAPRGAQEAAVASLARAAGGAEGRSYTVDAIDGGTVTGTITSATPLGGDTVIEPTHDQRACARLVERPLAGRNGTVGDAVVWIAGVSRGPAHSAPRRASLVLQRCQLTPRVLVVATGATILAHSRDAVMARLRFSESGAEGDVRTFVSFNDAGQVVPNSRIAASPGLVAVRDDMHPWVRAYVAVAPHPFVTVTGADGQFRFEGVPPGRYQLVVWHERRGTTALGIEVAAGVTIDKRIELR